MLFVQKIVKYVVFCSSIRLNYRLSFLLKVPVRPVYVSSSVTFTFSYVFEAKTLFSLIFYPVETPLV